MNWNHHQKLEKTLSTKDFGLVNKMLDSYRFGWHHRYVDNHSLKLMGRVVQLIHEDNLLRSYRFCGHETRKFLVSLLRDTYKDRLKDIARLKKKYKKSLRLNSEFKDQRVHAVFKYGVNKEIIDTVEGVDLNYIRFENEKSRYWQSLESIRVVE